MSVSKQTQFANNYLDNEGKSDFIERYSLEPPFYYSSGDGIFRMDGSLGSKYKYISVKGNKTIRYSWSQTTEEEEYINLAVSHLDFSNDSSAAGPSTRISRGAVWWFKFYGKQDDIICDEGIRYDIKIIIKHMSCSHCNKSPKPNEPTECDHKNDLKKCQCHPVRQPL